ncbi:hypothetical protein HMPREF1195_01811 [Streptococcus parasanguinis CC87K]|uniref:HTH cro/C1-type domain-containing protein n=1 Tax=Streptococcus parasanguinis CC87K TaxID=1073372 RepID=V8B967_STRPA|nr:hypothetical protein HMPREF1195_01811 [Streptococcus parasanguinis CC87K]
MNRLKELRLNKEENGKVGVTQQEVADKIGVTKRTYIYWEKNERQIKSEKAQLLADYFKVDVGYLLGYTDEPHKSMYDLAQQNPEDFPSDEDDLQDITPQGLVDASSENNKRYFYIENITNFVKDKKTTNSKLKLLSDIVDNFKKS